MIKITNIKRQIIFCGVAFSVLALLFGMWSQHSTHNSEPKKIELKNGTFFPIPREIKPFQLQSAFDGKPFTNEQLKGHWSMLFFGFTHCAMLCPTTLSSLNKTYLLLEQQKVKQLPHIVFISIDPERDSLKRINDYVKVFNKNFNGARGSDEKIEKLTKELSILYLKVAPKDQQDPDDYQIDHSGTVLLFDPNGHLAALFSPPIEPTTLAQDYQTVIDNWQDSGEQKK